MQVGETTIRLGTLGGYPSPLLKQGESHPQTPVFVENSLNYLLTSMIYHARIET